MFKSKNKKGTTLVEVLVASIILVIVIGSTLFFMVYNQTTIGEAGTEANATYIIKDWFESIKTQDNLTGVCSPTGNVGKLIGEANALTNTIDGIDYKLYFEKTMVTLDTSAVSPTNPELIHLTAHVKWKFNNRDRHVSMSMLSSKNDE